MKVSMLLVRRVSSSVNLLEAVGGAYICEMWACYLILSAA